MTPQEIYAQVAAELIRIDDLYHWSFFDPNDVVRTIEQIKKETAVLSDPANSGGIWYWPRLSDPIQKFNVQLREAAEKFTRNEITSENFNLAKSQIMREAEEEFGFPH